MTSKTKAAERARWFAEYQRAIEARPDYAQNAGRICWDTATYLYDSGKNPRDAAANAADPFKYEGAR
jgi:hypothetical protein